MTRKQVGTALGYTKSNDAIGPIHERNRERLDPLSTYIKVSRVEENHTVRREICIYTLRGVMEICRFSRQPNADGVVKRPLLYGTG